MILRNAWCDEKKKLVALGKHLSIHCIGDWVGPRACQDLKLDCPSQSSKYPGPSRTNPMVFENALVFQDSALRLCFPFISPPSRATKLSPELLLLIHITKLVLLLP